MTVDDVIAPTGVLLKRLYNTVGINMGLEPSCAVLIPPGTTRNPGGPAAG